MPSANGRTPTAWNGGPGNWSTIANWSGGIVPNNGNGGQFGGSFAFSGGNLLQFTLTSIPEPSALLVLFGGLGAMLSVRRRKVA